MSSIREQILAALLVRQETVPGATVKREAPLPETVPTGGLIMARAIAAEHADLKAAGADITGLPDLSDEDALAGLSQNVRGMATLDV